MLLNSVLITRKLPNLQLECDDVREDSTHCLVAEFVDSNDVEMAQEPRCDGVPAPSGWAHGSNHLQVHQLEFCRILLIIPVERESMEPLIMDTMNKGKTSL